MEIRSTLTALFNLFFPNRCLGCHTVIEIKALLCVKCTSELPFTHWKLNRENDAFNKISNFEKIENAAALLYFKQGNVAQKLLHALKYNDRQDVGEWLAEYAIGQIDFPGFQGVIPVPVHRFKKRKRGYNQVESFAQRLAKQMETNCYNKTLVRTKASQSMVNKNRTDRMKNLIESFAVNEKFPLPPNGHFLLVDDTLTTGATVSACLNALKKACPNTKYSVLTMATTE